MCIRDRFLIGLHTVDRQISAIYSAVSGGAKTVRGSVDEREPGDGKKGGAENSKKFGTFHNRLQKPEITIRICKRSRENAYALKHFQGYAIGISI